MKQRAKLASAIILFFGIITFWIASIITDAKKEQIQMSRLMLVEEANGHYKNISALKMWHDKYGGIFQKEHTPSNQTYQFSIASLRPKNPENIAKGFAKRGIDAFETNSSLNKYYEFSNNNDFKFMGVLRAEAFCLSCHKGYNVGDIRGGIVIEVPTLQFQKTLDVINQKYSTFLFLTFFFSFLTTVGAIIVSFVLLRRHEEVRILNHTLEQKVQDRTRDLDILYKHELYLKGLLNTIAVVNESLITSYSIGSIIDTSLQKLSTHDSYRLVYYSHFDGNELIIHHKQGDADKLIDKDRYAQEDPASKNLTSTAFETARTLKCAIDNNLSSHAEFPHKRKEDYALNGAVSLPIIEANSNNLLGILTILTSRTKGFESEEVSLLENLAVDLAMAISAFKQRTLVEQLQSKQIMNYEETILAFVNMIEQRDAYTAGHTLRVAKYCRLIAVELGLDDSSIQRIEKAAILHDIGKIATPDTILLKPGKLTSLEYTLIKNHVVAGYKMLTKIEMYRDLAYIIQFHHEHYDGTGYPKGLRKDEIPLEAHILIVADAFDAMTTNRIYKSRLDANEALNEIVRLSSRQFHPDIVTAASKVLANISLDYTTQMPENELEKQRFSYFFNDNLTGLYNEHYLQMTINQHEGYRSLNFIFLKKFSAFNKKFGWNNGNEFLKQFANELKKLYPDDMIFRYHGDDFIILSNIEKYINKNDIISINHLLNEDLECDIAHFSLSKYEDYTNFSEIYL